MRTQTAGGACAPPLVKFSPGRNGTITLSLRRAPELDPAHEPDEDGDREEAQDRLEEPAPEDGRAKRRRQQIGHASAKYLTPEFAAKVAQCKPGRARDIAEAVLRGESVATIAARYKTQPASVYCTLSRIARRGLNGSIRARTIAPKRLTREELRQGALLAPLMDYPMPRTRAECKDGLRPCPYVRCRHHLYLDVNPDTGSIKLNFPHLKVWEMRETCALDVADRGGATLEEVGDIMNLTRERVRQVEVFGLLKLKLALAEMEEER